jgi:pyruvate dehydrogenase E2 component (dihydrolipoamide acetyltransferase)
LIRTRETRFSADVAEWFPTANKNSDSGANKVPVESIRIPDIGDSSDVEVVEILVSEGQKVDKEESLLVLESDKAAMEIPSPFSGVVKKILLKVGDTVSEGKEMLTMEIEGEEASEEAAPADDAAEGKPVEQEEAPEQDAAAAAPAGSGEARVELVKVPDIGDESEVEIIEVHVAVGDILSEEDPLITLESDKAAMDIPSPFAGEVRELKVKVGDKVAMGAAILEMQVTGGAAEAAAASAPAPAQDSAADAVKTGSGKTSIEGTPQNVEEQALQQKQQAFVEQAAAHSNERVHAGPAVRKLARELGVNLGQVKGSGAKGRIQKEDVHEFVKARMSGAAATAGPAAAGAGIPAVPDIDFSQFGEIEEVAMSKLHRITAENMHRNWLNVPAVAQFNEADVTDLEAFRAGQKKAAEKKGVKLTPLPFLIKACAKALQNYPQFNVSLHSSGEKLIQKKYVHIGVAVATEAGLMVPVVRDADRKSIWEIAADVAELSEKARNRRLSKEDMQGACFTISSLGAIGGTGFMPIVNAPEVGILGVSKTQVKPVWRDGEFVPRQMLPFSLCYDHRAVNGMDAGMFAIYLADVLSDIRLLMM